MTYLDTDERCAVSTAEAATIRVVRRPWWSATLKRLMDVVGSLFGLIFLSPLMALIAAAVFLNDGRPVLFKWHVVGTAGRPFVGYKFRTMIHNAEQLEASLSEKNEVRGPTFKMRSDPRVTRLGAILRRTSLDELPQLISVLRGDMSLVGPRPSRVGEYERFTPFQRSRFAIKPGITCIWQVSGRNKITDFDTRVQLDREYIENWSLWLDVRILARTIVVVLTGEGAM